MKPKNRQNKMNLTESISASTDDHIEENDAIEDKLTNGHLHENGNITESENDESHKENTNLQVFNQLTNGSSTSHSIDFTIKSLNASSDVQPSNLDQFLNNFEIEFLKRLRERKAQLAANISKLKNEINCIKNEISCFDLNDKQILDKFNQGKQLFNEHPQKGIAFLIEAKLVQDEAKSIARFLFNASGLRKAAIGQYFSKPHQLNKQVLIEYIDQQNFKDTSLIDALRMFLRRFLLPSESQIIDRIMENFAHKYIQQNSDIYKSQDDCYVLCFALIMLNTLLHNPKIKGKYKPTIKRFIEDHPNVDEQLLCEFYENIKQNAFEMPCDDLNNELIDKPVKEGWLMKQSRFGSHYDRRWFVLSNRCLFYFLSQSDNEPKGIIPLENVRVRESFGNKGIYGFEIHSVLGQNKSIKACKRHSDGRIMVTKHLIYKFVTKDIKEEKEWYNALKSNISFNPYYDLLESRKRKFNKHRSLSSSIGLIKHKIFVR